MPKLNLDGLKKRFLEHGNKVIQERIETVVSLQYCPDHGVFASVEDAEQVAVSSDKVEHHYRYRYCCDSLRDQILQALRDAGLK